MKAIMTIGDNYNWINQKERLVYLGESGHWYQFAKVDSPLVVWCEVLTSDLKLIERTPQNWKLSFTKEKI